MLMSWKIAKPNVKTLAYLILHSASHLHKNIMLELEGTLEDSNVTPWFYKWRTESKKGEGNCSKSHS